MRMSPKGHMMAQNEKWTPALIPLTLSICLNGQTRSYYLKGCIPVAQGNALVQPPSGWPALSRNTILGRTHTYCALSMCQTCPKLFLCFHAFDSHNKPCNYPRVRDKKV